MLAHVGVKLALGGLKGFPSTLRSGRLWLQDSFQIDMFWLCGCVVFSIFASRPRVSNCLFDVGAWKALNFNYFANKCC